MSHTKQIHLLIKIKRVLIESYYAMSKKNLGKNISF
jgi:hypothetical protein